MSRCASALGAGGLSLLLTSWALDLKMLAPFFILGGNKKGPEMRILLLFVSLAVLSGCASTWDTRRQELEKAYQEGELSAESYFKLKADVDKEELLANDPFGTLILELEELYKANKISGAEYILEKEKLINLRLEQKRLEYTNSQKIVDAIKQEQKEQQEQQDKAYQLETERIKALRGSSGIHVSTTCPADSFGNLHCD